MVWTRILRGDSRAATDWMAGLEVDERVHVFDDANSSIGQALAKVLELPAMATIRDRWGHTEERLRELFHPRFLDGPACLFDSALVFDAEARSTDGFEPSGFATQLNPELFVGLDRDRYHPAQAFEGEVARLVELSAAN